MSAEVPVTDLASIEAQIVGSQLPPVHLWHPQNESTIDIRICRDGTWLYRGSAISRNSMVKLFSTVLRRDGEQYCLVTPVEKLLIEVDDAPFVAVSLEVFNESEADAESHQTLVFTTNVGDKVIADAEHPIHVVYPPRRGAASGDRTASQKTDQTTGQTTGQPVAETDAPANVANSEVDDAEPSPYIEVRDGLNALLGRAVWYQLAELAVERQAGSSSQTLGVHSNGCFFPLWSGENK